MSTPNWKDAPDWANWPAQDGDGAWIWFEKEPAPFVGKNGILLNEWRIVDVETGQVERFEYCGESEPVVNWQESKESRSRKTI